MIFFSLKDTATITLAMFFIILVEVEGVIDDTTSAIVFLVTGQAEVRLKKIDLGVKMHIIIFSCYYQNT